MESSRTKWSKTNSTLLVDKWINQNHTILIIFLVYYLKGTIFLKLVYVSKSAKIAQILYKLFREVMLLFGVENVVDNASNYIITVRLLESKFKTLFWSSCAAHCINLIFHYISKMIKVSNIIYYASKISKYIYNYYYPLHLMRKFN
uniref:DUF659 domain-containing protein n=1 Tax=Rhizophora mucronata TaxID=61149 RepID=A0A2P2NZ84_RHIMU